MLADHEGIDPNVGPGEAGVACKYFLFSTYVVKTMETDV
jgi:hypothetical protein